MQEKLHKTISDFWIISFELVAGNSQYYDENLSSAVNVLPNSSKISDLPNRDVFQLNLFLNDESIG